MTDAEKLDALRVALFPDPETVDDRVTVCRDAVENLDAVLTHIAMYKFDGVCLRTLQRIQGQLAVAKRIIEAAQ